MSILNEILENKRKEVADLREITPVKALERTPYFATPCVSLKQYLQRPDRMGVIAEIKRRSPSKGVIHAHIQVEDLSIGYMQAGASALSILTDQKYFGGRKEDLTIARRFNYCPILRKDFIVDEYQVVETKSIGADVILLIAAALDAPTLKRLAATAKKLGLETLLEVHDPEELASHLSSDIDLVGVNSRNLSTFETSRELFYAIASQIPQDFARVAESGISDATELISLKQAGYRGFLIGEAFMCHAHPSQACREFIREAQRLQSASITHEHPLEAR